MKKIFILFLSVFILTGCTMVRIDTNSIDNTINVVLSKENKLFNKIGKGYKYYIPRGVNYIDTNGLNEKLYSNGNYYYLYIDVISYYHKKEVNFTENTNAYYSKLLDFNSKKGYVEITKQEKQYLVEFTYNYAKIEALVNKDDIEDVILNASYILSTIKFNNNVIKLMLNEDFFTNKEEVYDLFKSKVETNTLEFSDEDSLETNEEVN